jgi:hypothetical protein
MTAWKTVPVPEPFAQGTHVVLVGKGDADDGDDSNARWQHIGEPGVIAVDGIAARVGLPVSWRLVALLGGGFVAWPVSGMSRADATPQHLVTDQYCHIQATVVEHRCITCADCDTSINRPPCSECNHYGHWSKAAPAEEKPLVNFGQVFDWALSSVEIQLVYMNTLAGKFSCKKCLAAIDHDGMCAACSKPEPLMCAFCGVQPRMPLERCRGRVVANLLCGDCFTVRHGYSEPHRLPAEDYSGEAVLDDLRRFVAGPCGRVR